MFGVEYRAIRRITRSYNILVKLNQASKQLKAVINDEKILSDSLEAYLKDKRDYFSKEKLDHSVTAYLLLTWIL